MTGVVKYEMFKPLSVTNVSTESQSAAVEQVGPNSMKRSSFLPCKIQNMKNQIDEIFKNYIILAFDRDRIYFLI